MRNALIIVIAIGIAIGGVSIVPTDESQSNIGEAYRFAAESAFDYWSGRGMYDENIVAGEFGEIPIIWGASGEDRGDFIYPDTLSGDRPFSHMWESGFDFADLDKGWSFNFPQKRSIAVLRSSVRDDMHQSVTWEYSYFRTFFDDYLGWDSDNDIRYYWDSTLTSISDEVKLLIIPAFEYTIPPTFYMDIVQERYGSNLQTALLEYLGRGGMIYAEGNAGYLLEALGLLSEGTVDFTDIIDGTHPGQYSVIMADEQSHPAGFPLVGSGVYTNQAPTLSEEGRVIFRYATAFDEEDIGKAACVEYNGFGGRMIVMAPSPTAEIYNAGEQWQVTAHALMSAFTSKVSLSRNLFTNFVETDSIDIRPFSLPVGSSKDFVITVRVRNLWDEAISDVTVYEQYDEFFDYVEVVSGPSPVIDGNQLAWNIPSLPPNSEMTIQYRLSTPAEEDARWYDIDEYLDHQEYIMVSGGLVSYEDEDGGYEVSEYRRSLYARFLFAADIVADTDLNWKNILGEYYQPFKIFMIMENKERTDAFNTRYVQYIPKDVPVYWVDPMAIPIIRTPGGEFVDLLRGSDDEGSPEYDMDGDGDPDAWLQVSSFQREPDVMVEEEIYWLNPWDGMYEDFDKDGLRAQDTDGDGVVDVEEPGDKIRAYRCEWDIDQVPGYQFFDPYVSWELWIDPPPLVDMAIGASIHEGLGYTGDPEDGYYYAGWENWMEKDEETGEVVMRRLVLKTIDSYTGYIFADAEYELGPGDTDMGWVPKPRQEYIAVLNLGGREPTMTSPTAPPEDTLYGKITYETLWGEHKTFPMRTSYTYYTPLPNPLQFEYISATFEIKDPESGERLDYLPAYDDAEITYHLTASTEYSYYWIMGVGQDFGEFQWVGDEWMQMSTDPDGLGDGVFGYMIHEIPKGLGAYSIELPRFEDGSFDIDAIVPDFVPFLHTHDSVATSVEIWEFPFYYAVYIPQILMPPALDDDNFDMVDDWLDDKGDRFVSETGYLHDVWPPEDGAYAEAIYASDPWDIETPIEGDLASPHEGWYWGEDDAYGDDLVEELGKYKITVNAEFHGKGQEGLIPINRGVWLVNEEIFGGSPWVQFSHAQSAYSKGNNIKMWRSPDPHIVSLYPDSVLMRWRIWEEDEPHEFDELFDPYIEAFADDQVAIVTHVGGKEPTGLFDVDFVSRARIDPVSESRTVTAIPDAAENPALVEAGYPKTETGAILTVIIEINNNADVDWYNLSLLPDLGGLGETMPLLWYASYPRPLVPTSVDPATGEVIEIGDDPTIFHAGWRFNSSELEVLNRIGDADGSAMIPQILSSRRAYYVFHFIVDPLLETGVYEIPFQLSGMARGYWEAHGTGSPVEYDVPSAKFAVVERDGGGVTIANPEFIIGQVDFSEFSTNLEEYVDIVDPASAFRWFETGWPNRANFDTYGEPISGSVSGDELTITGLPYYAFPPDPENTDFYIGAMATVDAPYGTDWLPLDDGASVTYNDMDGIERTASTSAIGVEARGSQMALFRMITDVNGDPVEDNDFYLGQGENTMTINLILANKGNDIARNVDIFAQLGEHAVLANIDPRYDSEYDEDTKLLTINEPFDLYPGSSREIPIELTVERTSGYDEVDIMYAWSSEFTDTDEPDARLLREMDGDTIRYFADFRLTDGLLYHVPEEVNMGDDIELMAEVHFQGNMTVKDPVVRFFEDDVQIGEDQTILELNPRDSVATVSVPFSITGFYHRIFATVDPDGEIGERDENNNTAMLEIITGSGKPLEDIIAYPSPFKDYTEFTYIVTRPIKEVDLKVFTVKGRLVRDFGTLPAEMGYNYVGWDGTDEQGDQIGNGTYVYKLIARDHDDESFEKIERVVRMR